MTEERKEEIWLTWDRFEYLESLDLGWLGSGQGRMLSSSVLTRAKEVLFLLLCLYPQLPRPWVYPSPDGGIQAEWDACVDIFFRVDGRVASVLSEERFLEFSAAQPSMDIVTSLALFFLSIDDNTLEFKGEVHAISQKIHENY